MPSSVCSAQQRRACFPTKSESSSDPAILFNLSLLNAPNGYHKICWFSISVPFLFRRFLVTSIPQSMPSAIGCAGLGHVTRHQQTLTLCDLVRPSGSGSRWKPVKSCRACTFHGRLRAKMLMPRLMLLLESSFCIKPQRQLQTGPRMSPWLISALHVKFKDFTFFWVWGWSWALDVKQLFVKPL